MAKTPPLKLTGMKELRKALKAGDAKVVKAAGSAVRDVTHETSMKSRELVPYEFGELSKSREVEISGFGTSNPIGEITYGSTAAPYAVIQHENEDFFHPAKHRGGTSTGEPGVTKGAKYLEAPMLAMYATFDKRIAKLIEKQL